MIKALQRKNRKKFKWSLFAEDIVVYFKDPIQSFLIKLQDTKLTGIYQ